MPEIPEAFDHMLAVWNERDPERIRSHLERALAPDALFIDPSIETHGIDAFEANVRDFRAKFPDAVCSRSSGVDTHHRLYRYHWEIHRSGELMLPGFDVVELDEQARVKRVEGFFGPVPPA